MTLTTETRSDREKLFEADAQPALR